MENEENAQEDPNGTKFLSEKEAAIRELILETLDVNKVPPELAIIAMTHLIITFHRHFLPRPEAFESMECIIALFRKGIEIKDE